MVQNIELYIHSRLAFIFLFKKTFVPGMRVELIRSNEHMALNHACLPIPAPGQFLGC